jgi:hypothetical protein
MMGSKYIVLVSLFTFAAIVVITCNTVAHEIDKDYRGATLLAQATKDGGETFEIIVRDNFGNEERITIPRGQSVIVSEGKGKNAGQVEIVVMPKEGSPLESQVDPNANSVLGYNQDSSPIYRSTIPLKQTDAWGLVRW